MNTMRIQDIAQALDAWAPPALAESYDNVGLLIGYPETAVTGILVNLDVTADVIREAKALGCNLIVTHHPIWFTARKRLNGDDYVSRAIMMAIQEGIALYAIHTNLDHVLHGVNNQIADRLELTDREVLQPKATRAGEPPAGAGMLGYLPQAIGKTDFLALVKEKFQSKGIRYADAPVSMIRKVAVCGGAGSFLIGDALRKNADAFVTADITYHKFFDNEERLLLLDIGHHESEQFTSNLIGNFLSENFLNFAVHLSKVNTNPVRYF
jgi:dinuclear metal center YbgI/SA1388 family protein